MQARLQELLHDQNLNDYTPAQIKYWLNLGIHEFEEVLMFRCGGNWFVTTDDINIVAGTTEYALQSDCLAVREVEWRAGAYKYPMKEVDFRDRELYEEGNISVWDFHNRWYVKNEKIGVIPTPTANATGGMRVYYYQQQADLSGDNDTPGFPSQFHFAPIYRAAMHALRLEEKSDNWIVAEWRAAVARAQSVFKRRVRGGRRYVKDLSTRGIR
jgi:hypothetical protein